MPSEPDSVVADIERDVFVRRGPPVWPSSTCEVWLVWCQGDHLHTTPQRDSAITKARLEAVRRGVIAWIGEPESASTRL